MHVAVDPPSAVHARPSSADAVSARPRVNINISRLVLRGFSAEQGSVIVAQLRAELARLLADPRTAAGLAQSRHLPALRVAAPVRMSATHGAIGTQAAASIVRGLRP